MEPAVAIQTSNEPTNKLAAGTAASAGVGGVVAGAIVGFGAPAYYELVANGPAILQGPGVSGLILGIITGLATLWASKKAGLIAGYNVLDKPNVPMAVAPPPTIPAGE